jgi:hypothetical protein
MVRSWCDRVHLRYGVSVTAVIHGTELMWPRAFMVRGWCDSANSFHVGPVLYSGNSFGGFFPFAFHQWRVRQLISLFICDNKNKQGLPFTTLFSANIPFLKIYCFKKIHQISYIRTHPWPMTCKIGGNLVKRRKKTKSTLRSWCNLLKWPYGVQKISLKWLLPVKVTLEVTKRHPKVFSWSCDEDPLK